MANVTIDSKLSTNGVLVRPQRFAYANARPGPEDLIVPALQNQKPDGILCLLQMIFKSDMEKRTDPPWLLVHRFIGS